MLVELQQDDHPSQDVKTERAVREMTAAMRPSKRPSSRHEHHTGRNSSPKVLFCKCNRHSFMPQALPRHRIGRPSPRSARSGPCSPVRSFGADALCTRAARQSRACTRPEPHLDGVQRLRRSRPRARRNVLYPRREMYSQEPTVCNDLLPALLAQHATPRRLGGDRPPIATASRRGPRPRRRRPRPARRLTPARRLRRTYAARSTHPAGRRAARGRRACSWRSPW
jgi:hypothetical protein